MKIAVIGAGAIGNLIAAYLKKENEDVTLIGHTDSVKAIKASGLKVKGIRGNIEVNIDIEEKLSFEPDLAIFATKTQDLEKALRENSSFLKKPLILTTQNGVCADNIVSRFLEKDRITSGIVMFGSTYLEPGLVVHNFEGPLIIGSAFGNSGDNEVSISGLLNKVFPVIVVDNIKGMKYTKIFVNSNNCISAILGLSMQQAFSDPEISRISINIWREGLDIVLKSKIQLESLPDFPIERIEKLTSMPSLEAAKIFSGIMTNLSKEPVYGSILQSIKRGRVSEIDYINGEFLNLAKQNNLEAPLNEKLVNMVHAVERSGKFFTKEQLLTETINR